MRPLYVPVRIAATVLAVAAAAAGCVHVGEDAGRVGPSRSAGQQGGKAPGGGSAVSGGAGAGNAGAEGGDGKRGRGGKGKPGESASASATPSGGGSASATPAGPRRSEGPGDPAPTGGQPSAPHTDEPTSTPPPPEPPVSPPPPATAEPSSSAHEEPGPQLVQREPAPAAGVSAPLGGV
ncbi:hypothetical protein ACWEKM_08575 [Streptomyces sp. NPDC004752]